MGWFDWLQKLFAPPPAAPQPPPSRPENRPPPSRTPQRPAAPSRPGPTSRPAASQPGGRPALDFSNSAGLGADAASGPLPSAQVPLPSSATAAPSGPDPLDLGRFAPLSTSEALSALRDLGPNGLQRWSGRRDLIPPVADASTTLVDRMMVGQGLATPEELASLHALQDQIDKLRPNPVLAQILAQQEIAQSLADKEARKARLKAEAAERKRLRAEGVAQRRATEIVFLGRGVSSGLVDLTSRRELLEKRRLPLLHAPADVAQWLEISVSRLRWLTFHEASASRVHYVRFQAPKRSGGVRELSAPHQELARCQRRILRRLLDLIPPHEAAHGFVKERSTATNAAGHVGQAVVVNCDLKDFFPSISFSRVKGIFRRFGYSRSVATVLALLCTEAPRRTVKYAGKTLHVATGPRCLPQGAATSPMLANLAAWGLDRRMSALCAKLGWKYTRYADDLTFSAPPEQAKLVGFVLSRFRKIAVAEGFSVNEAKTRVQRRSAAQSVTGAIVNDRVGAPRDLVRRLRAILHKAKTEGLEAQNRDQHPFFRQWLEGMIAYISGLNPQQAAALKAAFEALPPEASESA